jgi:hypothetical protein
MPVVRLRQGSGASTALQSTHMGIHTNKRESYYSRQGRRGGCIAACECDAGSRTPQHREVAVALHLSPAATATHCADDGRHTHGRWVYVTTGHATRRHPQTAARGGRTTAHGVCRRRGGDEV